MARDLLCVFSLLVLVVSALTTNDTNLTTSPPDPTTTAYFTTGVVDGCNSNYSYVNIKTHNFSGTVLSEPVNFAPYIYEDTIPLHPIVLFANGTDYTETSNNPCNASTWTDSTFSYNNKIVLLTYDEYYHSLCHVQKWILNLEAHSPNISAVLIGHYDELVGVIIIDDSWYHDDDDDSTDSELSDPTVPTRMISKTAAALITEALNSSDSNDSWAQAAFGCFNSTSHPSSICISDDSVEYTWLNAKVDGEYQQHPTWERYGYPVWFKEPHHGYYSIRDYYIWMSSNGYWSIGTTYDDDGDVKSYF